MIQFKAQIIDNGGKQRFYTYESSDISFKRAAKNIAEKAHVQNGGHVQVASMRFDYPSQSFITDTCTFDLIEGEVKNLRMVV